MKKALLALVALTLIFAVAGSVLGCNNGTTTKKPNNSPSSSPGPSNSPGPGGPTLKFLDLGAPDNTWWYSNGCDDKVTALTIEIFKAAKYLIIDAVSVAGQNGFGGLQLAVQGDADDFAWHQTSASGNWTDMTDILDYNGPDPFYIVVKTSELDGWDVVSGEGATQGKFRLNTVPNQIEVTKGYIAYDGTLAMPSDGVETTTGWAAKTIPEKK
jgi:hypothetical protein